RRPRTGAPRRLARDVLRAHPRREGGRPGDARRREGTARRRDSRPRSGCGPRAEARVPDVARDGARGRPHRAARPRARRARGHRRDARRLGRDGRRLRARCRRARRRGVGRGPRPAHAQAARRGGGARLRPPDGALCRRPGGAPHLRVRVGGGGVARRAGDPRPPRARAPRDRLRRPVPVLAARGLVHALGRACRGRDSQGSRVLTTLRRVAYEFRLPDLGEGLTEAEIARWLVAEGDDIGEDQPLVEIQTDKTTVEIPSPRGGTVLKVLVGEGDVAPVGAVLVVIGEEGEQLLRAVEDPDTGAPDVEPGEPLVSVVPPDLADAVRATPAVRRLAKELDVALGGLTGTGPEGRIVEADVRAAAAGAGVAQRIPVRGVRRAIVEQVTRAHREVPGVTFVEECDFGGIDLARLVAHSIHASAEAIAEYPEVNARLVGDEIVI